MASASFRDNMNSLGWSRRDDTTARTDSTTPMLSRLRSLNPFGGGEGYLRLPTHEPGAPLPAPSRREEEESFFARTYSAHVYLFYLRAAFALPCALLVARDLILAFLTKNLPARVISSVFLRHSGPRMH